MKRKLLLSTLGLALASFMGFGRASYIQPNATTQPTWSNSPTPTVHRIVEESVDNSAQPEKLVYVKGGSGDIKKSEGAIERPTTAPTVTMHCTMPTKDFTLKMRLFSPTAKEAIIDWGDGSPLEKVSLGPDPAKPADVAKAEYRGDEIKH